MLHTWVHPARQEARSDFNRTLAKYPNAPIGLSAESPEVAEAGDIHGVLKVNMWDSSVPKAQRVEHAQQIVIRYVKKAVERHGDLTLAQVEGVTRGTLLALHDVAEAHGLYRVDVDDFARAIAPELVPEQPVVEVETLASASRTTWGFDDGFSAALA